MISVMLDALKNYFGFTRTYWFGNQWVFGVLFLNQSRLSLRLRLIFSSVGLLTFLMRPRHFAECYAVHTIKPRSRASRLKLASQTNSKEGLARQGSAIIGEGSPNFFKSKEEAKADFSAGLWTERDQGGERAAWGFQRKGKRNLKREETRQGSHRVEKTPRMAQMMN